MVFVDLDAFESQDLEQAPEDRREFVQSLQSLGVVSTPVTDGESRGTMRLSVN